MDIISWFQNYCIKFHFICLLFSIAKEIEKEKNLASQTNERERGKREERLMEYNARIESMCLKVTACHCCKSPENY